MTRLLIVADMEGITGLERYEQCVRGHADYPEGVRLLCQEINVIADSALDNGARSVSVIDWHAGGGNLDPEQLDERVQIVPEDLSPGYDLALLVGFHPMAGDPNGFISHTMTQGVAVEVNGTQVGEIELISWWLGEHGVPVGLISGDRAATAEADRFFPDLPMHTVKRAESWSRAACVPAEQSWEALRLRVARVLEQRGRWQTYRLPTPLNIRLKLRDSTPAVALIPWLSQEENGWIAGKVDQARDVIDLLDVVAALISSRARGKQLDALAADPNVQSLMRQLHEQRIETAISRGNWRIE